MRYYYTFHLFTYCISKSLDGMKHTTSYRTQSKRTPAVIDNSVGTEYIE